MQAKTNVAQEAATAVTQAQGGSVSFTSSGGSSFRVERPQTAAELRALRQRRSEISDQITNVSNRRDRIAKQLETADPAARAGLVDRLKVLDDRIFTLEKELDVTGAMVREAPMALVAASQSPSGADFANRISGDIVPIIAILSVFVLSPIAIALSRFVWRRASAPPKAPAIDQASQARLDQLQQAVDTIAIEVERISEGQRFVTKLLSEKSGAVGPGPAEPARVPRKSSAPAER